MPPDPRSSTADLAPGVRPVFAISGHARCLGGVDASADGALVATASFDRTVRLWDGASGTPRRILRGATAGVRCVAVSPDGRHVAGGCDDGRILVWDAAKGGEPLVFEGHAGPVMAASYAPDGGLLATASQDRATHLWDPSGSARQTLHGHTEWIGALAFSPDGKLLATASDDATVRLWNPWSGEAVRTLRGHKNWIRGVAFSPDGRRIATASFDRTVRLWDRADGRLLQTLELEGRPARSVSFSSDGRLLAVAAGASIRLWGARSWEVAAEIPGHDARFMPRGLAVWEEDDPVVRVYDLEGLAVETAPPDPQRASDTMRLAVPGGTTAVRRGTLASYAGGASAMLAVAFTDIVDSSALTQQLGEERMGVLRREHFALVRDGIRKRNGHEVKTIGDSFLVVFRTAVDALDFALDVQERARTHTLKVRIGAHVGPVQVEEEDAFGSTVNFAARVEAMAKSGEIWLSERAKQDVDGEAAERHAALAWRERPDCALKGFPGAHRLWSAEQAPGAP
ncbi:MAG: hypothetical protein HYY18_18200 [Planctomycetes bacterium]|nr:hypothetical protein [Planctomycetota bacterium]